ncbi:MAG: hypothetical protein NTX45_29820 [Proteobacteria bacterium]|nr:hypothetical protein [Pseudomonadota bacterium]
MFTRQTTLNPTEKESGGSTHFIGPQPLPGKLPTSALLQRAVVLR